MAGSFLCFLFAGCEIEKGGGKGGGGGGRQMCSFSIGRKGKMNVEEGYSVHAFSSNGDF